MAVFSMELIMWFSGDPDDWLPTPSLQRARQLFQVFFKKFSLNISQIVCFIYPLIFQHICNDCTFNQDGAARSAKTGQG